MRLILKFTTSLLFLLVMTHLVALGQVIENPRINLNIVKKYFVKTDGSKIEFDLNRSDGGVTLTNEQLEYYDFNWKFKKIHQSEVKELFLGVEYYTLLPITKRYNRLLRVIASNDEYILSIYTQSRRNYSGNYVIPIIYLFVHNKHTKEIMEDKFPFDNLSANYELILSIITKYFPNCDILFRKMQANLEEQKKEKKGRREGPFNNINQINCP